MKLKFNTLLLLIMVLYGCAMTQDNFITVESFKKRYSIIEVLPVEDYSGSKTELDIAEEMTNQLKSIFRQKGYTIIEDDNVAGDVIIIENRLLNYKAGSAFNRWLMPGAGATQVTVKTIMTDKTTGAHIGDIITNKSISAGGLFTVGAEKSILRSAAKAIVTEVERRNKGKQ